MMQPFKRQKMEYIYGETYRDFFREHPNGAINAEFVIMKCNNCGEYDDPRDLSLYVPKEGVDIPEIKKKLPYARDLVRYYKKVVQFQHVCKKCGERLTIFRTYENNDDDAPPVYMRSKHVMHHNTPMGDAPIPQCKQPFICPNCKKKLAVRLDNFD